MAEPTRLDGYPSDPRFHYAAQAAGTGIPNAAEFVPNPVQRPRTLAERVRETYQRAGASQGTIVGIVKDEHGVPAINAQVRPLTLMQLMKIDRVPQPLTAAIEQAMLAQFESEGDESESGADEAKKRNREMVLDVARSQGVRRLLTMGDDLKLAFCIGGTIWPRLLVAGEPVTDFENELPISELSDDDIDALHEAINQDARSQEVADVAPFPDAIEAVAGGSDRPPVRVPTEHPA